MTKTVFARVVIAGLVIAVVFHVFGTRDTANNTSRVRGVRARTTDTSTGTRTRRSTGGSWKMNEISKRIFFFLIRFFSFFDGQTLAARGREE